MATSQWLQDNPKVLAYVSKDLYSKLHQFKKAHKLKSISEAINLILSRFFELEIPLNQPSNVGSGFSQENSLESRIVALENAVKQLVNAKSAIEDNLPTPPPQPSFEKASKKSDLLVGIKSELLSSQTSTTSLSQFSPSHDQDRVHLSQELPQTSSNPPVASIRSAESDLLIAEQKEPPQKDSGVSNLLLPDSKLLTPESSKTLSLEFNPTLQSYRNTSSLQNKQEDHITTEIKKDEELDKEIISKSAYFRGGLGLLKKNRFHHSDSIQTLAKTIMANPSCVCLSVLRMSRLESMACPYEGFHFKDVVDKFKGLNKCKKTPYLFIRDSFKEQISYASNSLKLDHVGENMEIPKARELAVSVKQLRERDDVFRVYIIPLSMLSRMLIDSGFPMTSSNLLKLRQYVEGIFPKALKLMYAELLEEARTGRRCRERGKLW